MSVGPGETRLHRTPLPRNSSSSTSCSPRTAYLLAAYAELPAKPRQSATLPTTMCTPEPRSRIGGRKWRAMANGASRLIATCSRNRSSLVSLIGASRNAPALLMTMSGVPSRRATSCNASSRAERSARSARRSSAPSIGGIGDRATLASVAPAAAIRRAVATRARARHRSRGRPPAEHLAPPHTPRSCAAFPRSHERECARGIVHQAGSR